MWRSVVEGLISDSCLETHPGLSGVLLRGGLTVHEKALSRPGLPSIRRLRMHVNAHGAKIDRRWGWRPRMRSAWPRALSPSQVVGQDSSRGRCDRARPVSSVEGLTDQTTKAPHFVVDKTACAHRSDAGGWPGARSLPGAAGVRRLTRHVSAAARRAPSWRWPWRSHDRSARPDEASGWPTVASDVTLRVRRAPSPGSSGLTRHARSRRCGC
jgi:hypothetical protein